MKDESKLKKDKELKKAVKGYMKPKKETHKYYIVSNPFWNGGKNYRVKMSPAKARRLSYQGYGVTEDYTQLPSANRESAMQDHKRLL